MIAHDKASATTRTSATTPPAQTLDNGFTYLTDLLESTLVITITDGRSFVGHFICTDRDQNIILNQAEEFLPHWTADGKNGQEEAAERPVSVGAWGGREVGMIMLRGRDIVKIEAQLPLDLQEE
jgi:small nuclear ribonucleoprotein (snRNP)-like protein